MDRAKATIQLRTELFDHGVFPCPHKLNTTSLLSLARSLYSAASADGKLSATSWAENAIHQLALTLHEAEAYFEAFRNIAYDRKPANHIVDVKPFALFLCLQLFSASTSRLSLENVSSLTSKFNAEFPGLGGTFPVPMASPRSKSARGFLLSSSGADYSLAHQFVKSNLRLMLKLVSSTVEGELTEEDINCLGLVLCAVGVDVPLGQLYPGLPGRHHSDEVFEWLNRKILAPSTEVLSLFPDIVIVSGLSKSVIVKESEWQGRDVRILSCDESYIYIHTNVKQVYLYNCKETILFIPGASKVVTVEKCEQCTVTVATNFLKIGNSVDCTLHVYSPWAPVLYGDNRGLTIGPFNAYYETLPRTTDLAGIPKAKNYPKCLQSWYAPIEMNSERSGHCFTDMLPRDFFKLVLPASFTPQCPNTMFTPEEFVKAQVLKEEQFQTVQKRIATANLTEDQEKTLHLAVQGHFREWLASSGSLKGPLELVRLIDQE